MTNVKQNVYNPENTNITGIQVIVNDGAPTINVTQSEKEERDEKTNYNDLSVFFDNPEDFNNYYSAKKLGEYKKNRCNDLGKIDTNCGINIIFGLPKIGKSVFLRLWKDNYIAEHKNIRYCYITYDPTEGQYAASIERHKYLLSNSVDLFRNIAKCPDTLFLIIVEDIEKIYENQELLGQLKVFAQKYCSNGIGDKNLKLFFSCWDDIEEKISFGNCKVKKIQLTCYNIEQIRKEFLDMGITQETFGHLNRIYGGHHLLLEHVRKKLENKTCSYKDLTSNKKKILTHGLLKELIDAINTIFGEINKDDLSVFQEIILLGRVLTSHEKTSLTALHYLSLLEDAGSCYIIHNFILTLAKEYFNNENYHDQFKDTGISLIKKMIKKDCKDSNESILREVLSTFMFLQKMNAFSADNTDILSYFNDKYSNDNFIINSFFRNDAPDKNKETLNLLRDIINDDYLYFISVNHKEFEEYEAALTQLEKFKEEKVKNGSFNKKSECQYYTEKGNILKRIGIEKNIDTIIECYLQALQYRYANIAELAKIFKKTQTNYSVNKPIKAYMIPVIELASLYLWQIKQIKKIKQTKRTNERQLDETDEKIDKLIKKTKDLLYKNYAILESHGLHEVNAPIYNMLGSFYEVINDNYKARYCYNKSYKLKEKNYNTLFNLGRLSIFLRDFENAYSYFKTGMDGLFEENNYIIARYYGICLREKGQYDEGIKYLTKALKIIESISDMDEEKCDKEKRETHEEIFLTLIKQTSFGNLENCENYIVHSTLLDKIIKRPDLLYNISENANKIKIIDWFLEKYKDRDNFKKVCQDLYSKKCKFILKSNNTELRLFLEKFDQNTPTLIPEDFSSKQRAKIARQSSEILAIAKTVNDYEVHRHYLSLYITFQKDHTQKKYSLLKEFFNKYDNVDKLLFEEYKNICIARDDLDFVRLYEKNKHCLSECLKHDFAKIAQIFLDRQDTYKANEFYKLSTESDATNFHNFLNYALFLLRICNFKGFWYYFNRSITCYYREKHLSSEKSKKQLKYILTAYLNSYGFYLFLPKASYNKFLEKNKKEIQIISQEFNIDFVYKILLAYYEASSNDIALTIAIANKQFKNGLFYIAKDNFYILQKKLQKKQMYEMYTFCNVEIAKIKPNWQKNELIPISEKINLTNKIFNIGKYETAFSLYNEIFQHSSLEEIDINKILEILDKYLYCSMYLDKDISLEYINDRFLIYLGERYNLLNKREDAINCYERCAQKSQDYLLKSEAYYLLSKSYNSTKDFDIASINIDKAVNYAYEALSLCYEDKDPQRLKENLLIPKNKDQIMSQRIETTKKLLEREYFLEATLLFEQGKYKDSFILFNRAYFKTSYYKLPLKKRNLYESLNDRNKKKYKYEYDYIEASTELVKFIQEQKQGGINTYLTLSAKVFKDNNNKYSIMKDIIDVCNTFNKGAILPDKSIDLIRDTYLHYEPDQELNSSFWMRMGTLFKDVGERKNNDKKRQEEMYMYAEIFYKRMKCKSEEDFFYFYNNMTLLLITKVESDISVEEDDLKYYSACAVLHAEKCENNRKKFLGYIEKHTEEYNKAVDTNKYLINNRNSKESDVYSSYNLDSYMQGLTKLDISLININSILKCKLKTFLNYGFFFTYINGDSYIDRLLHKKAFSKDNEYLIYILRRINPFFSCDFSVEVKRISECAGNFNPEFSLSVDFEQEVLTILDDYICKNETSFNLANLRLEFLPESIQTLQHLKTLNITGNPLSKLRLDFFDTIPNLQNIEYDQNQKKLVSKLQSHSNKLAHINWIEMN